MGVSGSWRVQIAGQGAVTFERGEQVERVAVEVAMSYERSQGRAVTDVGDGYAPDLLDRVQRWRRCAHPCARSHTCDLVSQGPDGTIARLIEVKGRGARSTSVSIVDRQREAMLGLGSDWWLYVVLDCRTEPTLVVVREPARLPWQLLTPPAQLDPGQYRRVDQEGRWHVSPRDVLDAGEPVAR